METGITQSIRAKVKAKNKIDVFIYLQSLSNINNNINNNEMGFVKNPLISDGSRCPLAGMSLR